MSNQKYMGWTSSFIVWLFLHKSNKKCHYICPKIYFKSIILFFSFVIFVKLHLGVDLQAHTSKPESELKSPTFIFQSTHTKCQGGSPMNVVSSTSWFTANIPIFKTPCMWDNSHDVNKMHHAFKYQQ